MNDRKLCRMVRKCKTEERKQTEQRHRRSDPSQYRLPLQSHKTPRWPLGSVSVIIGSRVASCKPKASPVSAAREEKLTVPWQSFRGERHLRANEVTIQLIAPRYWKKTEDVQEMTRRDKQRKWKSKDWVHLPQRSMCDDIVSILTCPDLKAVRRSYIPTRALSLRLDLI